MCCVLCGRDAERGLISDLMFCFSLKNVSDSIILLIFAIFLQKCLEGMKKVSTFVTA